jgi:hypothetical protein
MTNSTVQVATAGPVLPGEQVVQYVPGAVIQAAISKLVYVVPSAPMTGADLLQHASRFPLEFPSKSDLVAASGHVKAGGKISFVSFYETLLQAKLEADPNYYVTIDEASDEEIEYDNLSHPLRKLYDKVYQQFGEKWSHSEILEFMQLLNDDIGITTVQQLEDTYYSTVDNGWNWEAEFAEEYVDSLEYGLSDSMAYSAIDWQKVWDHNLTYEFATIGFDGDIYLFNCCSR